jgi:sterol desaturase/sphingolipid hydroxylase (fatty acid hydroxylase superfamily)
MEHAATFPVDNSLDLTVDLPKRHSPRALLAAGFLVYLAILALAWWAVAHVVPDQMSFAIAGHSFAIRNIHLKISANGLILLILPTALWLESMAVGWQRSSARKLVGPSASVKSDIACFVLSQAHLLGLFGRILMLGVSLIPAMWLHDWLKTRWGFSIDPAGLPIVVQAVLYFYVYSFFDYWVHRIGHTRWFWPLHRYHHSATEFSVVSAERMHPVGFAQIFLVSMPMAALGATPEALIYVNIVTAMLGYLIHSEIQSDWGWVGRTLLQSPLHHRLHHKLDMSLPTCQFSMTPMWDYLFGTWGHDPQPGIALGVDTPYRHGFLVVVDLLRDYVDFWKGLVGKRSYSPSERA